MNGSWAVRQGALCTVAAILVSGGAWATEPSEESLAGAFLAHCNHSQACMLAELTANPQTDPVMLEMIQTRMAGQCEAQLAKISQYEDAPQAQAMALCFRTMTTMSCEALRAGPEISECSSPTE